VKENKQLDVFDQKGGVYPGKSNNLNPFNKAIEYGSNYT
jgi:hypothetical protein